MTEEKNVYLRIKVEGQEKYLKAFCNEKKSKESEPDYSGEGVLVWLNEARPKAVESEKPFVEVVRPAMRARRF